MKPEHIIELCLFLLLAGIAIGYGFRGLWNRLLHRANLPIYGKLNDVKTVLHQIYDSGETDIVKFKAKLAEIIAKVEKLLP